MNRGEDSQSETPPGRLKLRFWTSRLDLGCSPRLQHLGEPVQSLTSPMIVPVWALAKPENRTRKTDTNEPVRSIPAIDIVSSSITNFRFLGPRSFVHLLATQRTKFHLDAVARIHKMM